MTTILCVDDNDTNLFMLSAILKRTGFQVRTALDGEQAVAACLAEAPDIVLMDVQLPGIDGFEATRRIRAAPGGRRIPVIALSAHEAHEKAAEARAAGCDGYVGKPLNVRLLLATIQDLLGPLAAGAPRPAAGKVET